MNSIQDKVAALTTGNARSALYYLSRYLKQAAHFNAYRKDVFEDTERSAPSKVVRQATLEMIRSIEDAEGIPASAFDDQTYRRWAARVREIENALDPELTETDLARARKFLDEFGLQNPKT
jgi:hypothetical protein